MKLIDLVSNPKNELRELFTVRTTNLLERVGITTYYQLSQADDMQLLKIVGFGRKNLVECIDLLTVIYKEHPEKLKPPSDTN